MTKTTTLIAATFPLLSATLASGQIARMVELIAERTIRQLQGE